MFAAFHKFGSFCGIFHSYWLMLELTFINPISSHLVSHPSNQIIHDLIEIGLEFLICLINFLTVLNCSLDFFPQYCAFSKCLRSLSSSFSQFPHYLLILVLFYHNWLLLFLLIFIYVFFSHLC